VLVITPPKDAFGEAGNPQLGVEKTDTIVTVFDILESFNGKSSADGTPVTPPGGLPTVKADKGKAPVITIPSGYSPSGKLVVQPLLEGDGEILEAGDTLIAQYVGVNARDGKVFDSSWQRGSPANFPIGTGGVIPGWDEGLVGKKLGSRVLLVIPPAKGYGKAGNEGAGIKGTDTLVFVVDLLARQAPPPDATDTTTAQP
jgi:peptidylprolyl isomerase